MPINTHRLRRATGFTFAGLVLGAAGLPHMASAASDDDVLAAVAGVYSYDMLSRSVVQLCAAEATPNAALAERANQSWRQRFETREPHRRCQTERAH